MGKNIIKGFILFLVGIVIGFSAHQFLSPSLSSYLPQSLQDQTDLVEGTVVRKSREDGKLLLTVSTPRGALLSTFTKKISEIDLLVEEGDSILLGITHYEPFVNDPHVKGVMKPDMKPDDSRLPAFPSTPDPDFDSPEGLSAPSMP